MKHWYSSLSCLNKLEFNMVNIIFKIKKMALLFFLQFIFCGLSYALPFTLVTKAGTLLPTTVGVGNSVSAYYTLSNNTLSMRNNNYVKYLPPNTFQVTTNGTYADTCSTTFNLAPAGRVGSTCTLQLTITGPVNARDPDPHHHLFACFPGGLVCAGTINSLNVQQVPSNLSSITLTPNPIRLQMGSSSQIKATATHPDGTSTDISNQVVWSSSNPSVATVSSTGLVTAISSGSTNITATSGSITSAVDVVTVFIPTAYVSNFLASTIEYCQLLNGTFNNCTTTGSGFNTPVSIALNPNASFLYVPDNGLAATVSVCSINADSSLGTCNYNTVNISPTGIIINSNNTYAYLTNDIVGYCQIDTNAQLINCAATATGLNHANQIALNSANTYAYITRNNSTDLVTACAIQNDGSLNNCTDVATGISNPAGIAINPANTFLYVTSVGNNLVYYCPVLADATLGPCVDTGGTFNGPFQIAIDPTGNYAYIANVFNNTVSSCSINVNGSFGVCVATGSGFNGPIGVAVT